MKKQVYSLVLGERVISEIDKHAYRAGTSRSNLINQVLAEHVGFITPEKRMREIFRHVDGLIGGRQGFHASLASSDTALMLRSALNYKYNPSVKYCATLADIPDTGLEVRIQVSLRSQNKGLLQALRRFFAIWIKIEQAYGKSREATLSGAKLEKTLSVPEYMAGNCARQADFILSYIKAMDSAQNAYFSGDGDMVSTVKAVELVYLDYLKGQN